MKTTDSELQKLDFTNNNHSIIYAPNSTGKTRLTKKLAKKYSEEQAMFFTSTEINNMLSFSGRKIYVGSESSFKVENDNIVKEYNKNRFGDELLKIYDSKNAVMLTKNSCLFNRIGIKRKDTFEIYYRLNDFLENFVFDDLRLNEHDMPIIDKKLSQLDLESIERIASENIKLLIADNEYTISKELKDKIQSIFDSIDSTKRTCPLCGCNYDNNEELKTAIKRMLEKYVISSDANEYELCVDFLNVLGGINNLIGFELFQVNYLKEITADLLLGNLNVIEVFLLSYSRNIISKIDETTDKNLFVKYKNNKVVIDKEESLRRSNTEFSDNVLKMLNELIALPDGFSFRASDNKVEVIDLLGKTIDPKEFLSESEQRRMCISIVFAEINQRNLQYIIFDDPVDSNDDYYFDISVNVIGDLLLTNQTLNWIVLTHEFRVISILSERCRLLNNGFSENINFLFYLPDSSFNGTKIPPFFLINEKANSLGFLNEHETIIFKKIFTGSIGYQCDRELALLSSFNASRNLYNEILKKHRISKHKSKSLCNAISKGNKSIEHFKDGTKQIMRLSSLFVMNKLMYDSVENSYSTRSRVRAANYRHNYVSTISYSSIHCDNNVLKYILFAMVRVMDSHYLFEKKLAKWASINIPSFTYVGFESAMMLFNKLKYVESICPITKMIDFKKYENCFSKWRGLLNDFAHSATRMIPPYLTISPMEMSKLEKQIKALP